MGGANASGEAFEEELQRLRQRVDDTYREM
jgi:hypothetical protein